jgi:hypothetical protein
MLPELLQGALRLSKYEAMKFEPGTSWMLDKHKKSFETSSHTNAILSANQSVAGKEIPILPFQREYIIEIRD